MFRPQPFIVALALAGLLVPRAVSGQGGTASQNDVLQRIWTEGMTERSQAYRLAQELVDGIGPRLMGTAGHAAAVDWALEQYAGFGIPARREQYGTWNGWRRGTTHAELISPRHRDLDATLLAYSDGTDGVVEGDVVLLPDLPDAAAYDRWFAGMSGAFVLASPPQVTCRPADNLATYARPGTLERLAAQADSIQAAWTARTRSAGNGLGAHLSSVAGVIRSSWLGEWGINRVLSGPAGTVTVDVSCEDHALLHRLAENGQSPRMRLRAEAEHLGPVPAYNVVAEIRGTERPEEYVLFSAHFDSWDGADGATDNGTGTIMMMEAMRILKAVVPSPRRSIIVGHWGGEEQGLIGSRAFAEDHPEVVRNIHVGFNQDNGTWRIEAIRMQGFDRAEPIVGSWLARMPAAIAGDVAFTSPDQEGGSDHTAFTCHGVPVVRLQANYPDYRATTWHTGVDTFDKIVMDDLMTNATLAAMLAYLASEEPELLPRERAPLADAQGRPQAYPSCGTARRAP